MESKDKSCHINCNGLYADADFKIITIDNHTKDYLALENLKHAYDEYKNMYVENMFLDKDNERSFTYLTRFKSTRKPYHDLQVVQIYFDTATYDEIVKDVSVTLADQLGAIANRRHYGTLCWFLLPKCCGTALLSCQVFPGPSLEEIMLLDFD